MVQTKREKKSSVGATMDDSKQAKASTKSKNNDKKHQENDEENKEQDLDAVPPQQVSSDDEDPENTDNHNSNTKNTKNDAEANNDKSTKKDQTMVTATTTTTTTESTNPGDTSRLFAPYRTVGIVSSGQPFYLVPNQNSLSTMLCLPIGERFHILQCDKLQPILVSQKVPGPPSKKHNKHMNSKQQPQHISQMVSDTTLSISVVAHGIAHWPQLVTLYARTRPIQTLEIVPRPKQQQRPQRRQGPKNDWKIVDLLHLGHMKVPMTGEKQGKVENMAIVAAILANHDGRQATTLEMQDEDHELDGDEDGVAVVGYSDDDNSSDDDSSSASSEDEEGEGSTADCCCQVVILLASRESISIHKRISLTTLPTFVPRVAVHPSTYVNKIILGGSDLVPQSNKDQGSETESSPALLLLNIRSGKVVHTFSCISSTNKKNRKDPSTSVTALEQSPAVDTVAVGTSHGRVHLVNLRHDKTLFTVNHKPRDGGSPSSSSSSSSPAVRITSISFRTDGSAMNYGIAPMAVGRSDGNITVWDLNPPENNNDDDDNVGTLTSKAKLPRTILCEMNREHPSGVSKIMYLPQEPLLVSIGRKSNSVLMHIFDNPDHSARILRQRKGHTAPPSRIRYLHPGASGGGGIMVNMADGTDASACQILSSGGADRTLRIFSTVRSVLDKEYSQGKGLGKKAKKLSMDSAAELLLPPLIGMAKSEARSRDWGDLVTIHKDHAMAYVWSTKRGSQWGPVLRQTKWNVSAMKSPPPMSTHAVSVAMSACGNFAVIGTKGGVIYKYNVQSGHARGCYPRDAEEEHNRRKRLEAGDVKRTMRELEKKMKISNRPSNLDKHDRDAAHGALVEELRQAKLKLARHTDSAVTGLAVDSTNKTMISVGADSKLILWNFATHAPHRKSPFALPNPATMLFHIRDSDLAAIALEDYSALLFDCTTLSIVRRFGGSDSRHSGPISDLGFSPDGRTLYTSSLDSTVRVWDVPTNTCVDWLGFETPPTSLTVSATGEYLATSHIGKLGLSIWSDRSFYQTVKVDGARKLNEPYHMDEPRPLAEVWEHNSEATEEAINGLLQQGVEETDSGVTDDANESRLPAVAKHPGLVTLSNLPPAHWKNLFHLELIKQRNKPKEPPKKPPSAPFFLQWRGGEPLTTPTDTAPEPVPDAKDDEDEWKAAWSDDEDEDNDEGNGVPMEDEITEKSSNDQRDSAEKLPEASPSKKKRGLETSATESRIITAGQQNKRKKIRHHRSQLATLLYSCSSAKNIDAPNSKSAPRRFQAVSDHVASLGPSAIDVSLSTLCNGMHDLEEGLPLLRMACLWLIEACESRERYEAVNAYLHRFLHLHATVIAGVEDKQSWESQRQEKEPGSTDKLQSPLTTEEEAEKETLENERRQLIECLSQLRMVQKSAMESLRGQMQSSLCLLRHFSRMV